MLVHCHQFTANNIPIQHHHPQPAAAVGTRRRPQPLLLLCFSSAALANRIYLLPCQQQQHSRPKAAAPATAARCALGADAASLPTSPPPPLTTTATTTATTAITTPAVALDVEYAHYVTADGRQVSVPAWLAVVDQDCTVLLKTFIQHQQQVKPGARWIGGVTALECMEATTLADAVRQLQELVSGRLLLGHGLSKDLAALGFSSHPQGLRFDTMTHTAFCNKAGSARNLKQLAKQFLALDIQQQQQQQDKKKRRRRRTPLRSMQQQQGSPASVAGKQQQQQQQPGHAGPPRQGHDPEEDAAAVMRLYQQVVFPSTYEGKVAAATAAALLASMHQGSQQLHEAQRKA